MDPMPPGQRPIRFLHRGRTVQLSGLAPTTTVLSWLREQAACTGTKEGCNEGDCGACMVAVAQLDGEGRVTLQNLNSCLMYLPTLDGKALFGVEDLSGLCGGRLHPVQQAMIEHHGSQCGFCTPGFVMTMWTVWQSAQHGAAAPSRQDWADALAGNLCRCTGYRPILDAAQACMVPEARRTGVLDLEALRNDLSSLAADADLDYSAPDPALGDLRRFSAPGSSDALAACLESNPGARILGGATDIGLWTNKQHRDVGHLVYTGLALDLRKIEFRDGWLRIGGAVTLEAAWQALQLHWPVLGDLWRRFASPPVRHAGTMAGNVANGSPIGDGPPVLMALGARLILRRAAHRRVVPLDGFYSGYQRNGLTPGEFIEWIEMPMPERGQVLRAWKVSKRYDSDISAVCAAFGLKFEAGNAEPGGDLREAILAFGGMAATVTRASRAERALLEGGWNESSVRRAQEVLGEDFQPIGDQRASAAYRIDAARALLQRLWLSIGADGPNGHQPPARPTGPLLEVWR